MKNPILQNILVLLLYALLVLLLFPITQGLLNQAWDFSVYLHIARWVSEGGIIYKGLGDVKSPFFLYFIAGIYALYGYIYGDVSNNIIVWFQIILFIILTLIAFFTYYLLQILYNKKYTFIAFIAGSVALFIYALIDHSTFINQPQFSLLFVLIASIILVHNNFLLSKTTLFIAGFFLGLAFLSSNLLILYTLLIPILLYYKHKSIKQMLMYSVISFAGFLIPLAIIVAYYIKNNALYDLYYWNIYYTMFVYDNHKFYYKIIGLFRTKEDGYRKIFTSISLIILTILYIKSILQLKRTKTFNITVVFIISIIGISILSRLSISRNGLSYVAYLLPFFSIGLILYWQLFIKKILTNTKPIIVIAISLIIIVLYTSDYYLVRKRLHTVDYRNLDLENFVAKNNLTGETIVLSYLGRSQPIFYSKIKYFTTTINHEDYINNISQYYSESSSLPSLIIIHTYFGLDISKYYANLSTETLDFLEAHYNVIEMIDITHDYNPYNLYVLKTLNIKE